MDDQVSRLSSLPEPIRGRCEGKREILDHLVVLSWPLPLLDNGPVRTCDQCPCLSPLSSISPVIMFLDRVTVRIKRSLQVCQMIYDRKLSFHFFFQVLNGNRVTAWVIGSQKVRGQKELGVKKKPYFIFSM